jgi:uncharacterized protein (DUF952 family)
MATLYKICSVAEWAEATAVGAFTGSEVDQRDGFIHLSAAHQVRDTAARHFAGRHGLVLVAYDGAALANLKWEPSRGGDLFPHVYGMLPAAAVIWAKSLPWADGGHVFPGGIGP